MKIFVNARFLTQPVSGVQRYGIECSLQIKKYYGVPASKITVTYNGISQKLLSLEQSNAGEKEKIILSVGSFNKRKNHQTLINAFLQSDIKSAYQLIIVGDKNKVFSETG